MHWLKRQPLYVGYGIDRWTLADSPVEVEVYRGKEFTVIFDGIIRHFPCDFGLNDLLEHLQDMVLSFLRNHVKALDSGKLPIQQEPSPIEVHGNLVHWRDGQPVTRQAQFYTDDGKVVTVALPFLPQTIDGKTVYTAYVV